jgi:hypothetical protein
MRLRQNVCAGGGLSRSAASNNNEKQSRTAASGAVLDRALGADPSALPPSQPPAVQRRAFRAIPIHNVKQPAPRSLAGVASGSSARGALAAGIVPGRTRDREPPGRGLPTAPRTPPPAPPQGRLRGRPCEERDFAILIMVTTSSQCLIQKVLDHNLEISARGRQGHDGAGPAGRFPAKGKAIR